MPFQADTKRIGQGLKSGNTPSLLSFRRNDYDEECIFITTTSPKKNRNARHFFRTKPPSPDQNMIAGIFPPNQLSLPILN